MNPPFSPPPPEWNRPPYAAPLPQASGTASPYIQRLLGFWIGVAVVVVLALLLFIFWFLESTNIYGVLVNFG
jgi:tetrahydromethanopterin S-methyltransferase subunit B